ncbi:MAG: undecaprenyl-diphosphate phosphatase [Planctomycetales bacterium]
MKEVWEAILLGVVQGITEFLPISSDGHLAVAQALMNGNAPSGPDAEPLEMIMVLHLGTLFSILLLYRKQIWELRNNLRLCALIILATIPVAVIGLSFKDFFDRMFKIPMVAGIGFLVTAFFLWLSEWKKPGMTELNQISIRQALWIGLCQTLAPFPGISRSGSTISGALIAGLERNTCTTFSFLLAIPAIGGACAVVLKNLFKQGTTDKNYLALGLGGLTAFVVGCLAIQVLIRIVNGGKLYWFRNYCLVLGIAVIVWQFISPTTLNQSAPAPPAAQKTIDSAAS